MINIKPDGYVLDTQPFIADETPLYNFHNFIQIPEVGQFFLKKHKFRVFANEYFTEVYYKNFKITSFHKPMTAKQAREAFKRICRNSFFITDTKIFKRVTFWNLLKSLKASISMELDKGTF